MAVTVADKVEIKHSPNVTGLAYLQGLTWYRRERDIRNTDGSVFV